MGKSSKLSLLLFFIFVEKVVLGFSPVTVTDRMFVGNVHKIKSSIDWLKCLESCSGDSKCMAYSYTPLDQGARQCELYMCGVKNSCQLEKDSIEIKGIIGQIIRPLQDNLCGQKKPDDGGLDNNATNSGHGPSGNASNNVTNPGHGPSSNASSNVTNPGHGPSGNVSSNVTNPGHGPSGNASNNVTNPGHGPSSNASNNVTNPGHGPSSNASSNVTNPGHGPSGNASNNVTNPGHGPSGNASSNVANPGHGPSDNVSSNATNPGHEPSGNASSNVTDSGEEIFSVNVTDSCPKSGSNAVRGRNVTTVCQGSSTKIRCTSRRSQISVKSVKYGRAQGCSCECGKCHNLSTECDTAQALKKTIEKCAEKKVCHVTATNKEFGNPCKGIKKLLVVEYSCKEEP